MIHWDYLYGFLGFILTGAISLLGLLAIVVVFMGVVLLPVVFYKAVIHCIRSKK